MLPDWQIYNEQFFINERELIKRTVLQLDQYAELFLLGPGTKYYGRQIDIYIKSKCLTADQRWKIKQKLNTDYFLPHIEMVCGIDDEKLLENLKVIGLAI